MHFVILFSRLVYGFMDALAMGIVRQKLIRRRLLSFVVSTVCSLGRLFTWRKKEIIIFR